MKNIDDDSNEPHGRAAGSPQDDGANDSSFDRFFRTAFRTAMLLIAFVTGGLLTAANLFPGSSIANAYKGGAALYQQLTAYDDALDTDLWYPERTDKRGVVQYDPALAKPGLTLYTSGHEAAAYLIDKKGTVVHKWARPFSSVWTKASGIKKPVPDDHVYFRQAHVFPNGDLLAIYEGAGDTPYGYGMVKLDKDSNVLWTYWGRTHHAFDVGPDGRIYALTQAFVNKPDPDFSELATPRITDFAVILSPDGKELENIPLFDAVAKSRYRNLLYGVSAFAVADPLHSNHITLITPEMARNFPFAKPGQMLVSFRELALVAVLDADTKKLEWGLRGSWIGQHDPSILENGHLLIFDNYGNIDPDWRLTTRVIEVNPTTEEVVWKYAGNKEHPLGSLIRGEVERLDNGNTLITEASGGRIVEVTPDGKTAWEFVNPVRGGHPGGQVKIPIINAAQWVDPATLDFLQQNTANTIQEDTNS